MNQNQPNITVIVIADNELQSFLQTSTTKEMKESIEGTIGTNKTQIIDQMLIDLQMEKPMRMIKSRVSLSNFLAGFT